LVIFILFSSPVAALNRCRIKLPFNRTFKIISASSALYATRQRNLSHFYGGANVKQLAKGENPAWASQQNGNDPDVLSSRPLER